MAERITGDPRELSFYGEGKAESINRGYAITSLRNPRPQYDFKPGERILADCKDDNEKVPVIVVSNVIRELADQPIPVLAMDGFFSPEMAVDGMKVYPGYEHIDQTTSISAIIFVKEESFLQLSSEQQQRLIEDPIESTINEPEFRHLFFPTMAFWLTEYQGSLDDWVSFLEGNDLISDDEAAHILEYEYRGSSTAKRFIDEHPKALQEISLLPDHEAFKPLILGIS